MANKVDLKYDSFKRMVSNGDTTKLIQFLTKQKIGKIEFISEPWSFDDKLADMPQTYKDKFGGSRVTKWVIDLENNQFIKLVNGNVDVKSRLPVGESIGEIQDLIRNDKSNGYSKVVLFRRTSIPGKTSGKFSNESKKPMIKKKLIESAVRKIVKKVLNEASLEKDPVRAYIQTALWSTSDMDSDGGDNLDANYSYDDVSPKSISRAKKDLGDFIKKVKQAGLLELYLEDFDYSQLGHDFWLTRNGHGAGFWDRSYSNDGPDGNDLGKAITQIAKQFPEVDGYVGDDGMVYFE